MKVKIEEMDLNEVYRDYKSLKELTEKYYYYAKDKLHEATEALLKALLAEASKRTIHELETNYNNKIVIQINKDRKKSLGKLMVSEDDDIEDFETLEKKKKKNISNGFIVYTTDGGKTFLASSPYEWKYDMGIPVGYVIGDKTEKKENSEYSTVTICATTSFRHMTLFGGKIDNIKEGYHFTSTLYEAGNDYNGIENTKYLYDSLNGKDSDQCALTTVVNYKIVGVDKDAIQWYIPSCGEIKDCLSAVTPNWLETTLGVERFYSILTSNLSSKDSMWVYGIYSRYPTLTNNVDWDYTLLPFAKVKVAQD